MFALYGKQTVSECELYKSWGGAKHRAVLDGLSGNDGQVANSPVPSC